MSQPAAASYLEEIIEHCKQAKFTGLLRMRSQQGEGELWFLSGVRDDARFGVSHGDEALERMGRANEPTFELVPRLPPTSGASKRGYPLEGSLGELRPVDLFRFCETNALTCTLELSRGKTSARARYQLGELIGVESDSADAAGIAQMLEWTEGNYRFELPPLELPADVPVYTPAAPVAEVLANLGLDKPSAAPAAKPSEPARAPDAQAKRAEEEAARKRAEEEAARKRAEEEAARKRAEEEAARKRAEEEAARKRAEEEAARKRAEEEAARKRAEEEAARKRAEEEEARRRAEEEEAKRKAVAVHRQITVEPSEPPRPEPNASPTPPAAEARSDDSDETTVPAPVVETAPPSSKSSQASAPEIAVSEAPESEAEEEEPEKPAKSQARPAKSAEKKPKSERRKTPAAVVESEPPPAPKKGAPWLAIFVVLILAAAAAYFYAMR